MVFALILILTADNELVSYGGQMTADRDACIALIKQQSDELAARHLSESLHIDARCLNLAPLPTDSNPFQPRPSVDL